MGKVRLCWIQEEVFFTLDKGNDRTVGRERQRVGGLNRRSLFVGKKGL